MHVIRRKCYNLIELVSDVGGAAKGLHIMCNVLTLLFVRYEFLTLFANRMYIWSPYNLEDRELGTEVPVDSEPNFHLYSFLTMLGCKVCYRNSKKKKYEAALKKVKYDLEDNLNIMTILRRLRMHGYAIDFLTKRKVSKAFTELAAKKPIRYIKLDSKRFQWD